MSDRFGLMGLATIESQYLEGRAVLNCSDVTAAAVDEEVRKIMEDCYNESKRILSENMEAMDMIADELIREETISGKDFMRLYRQAKGLPEPDGSEKAEKAEENADRSPTDPRRPKRLKKTLRTLLRRCLRSLQQKSPRKQSPWNSRRLRSQKSLQMQKPL